MGLRAQAELDLAGTIEASDDYGWPVLVTDPAGTAVALTGSAGVISEQLDAETGLLITAQRVAVSLRISSIVTAFPSSGLPQGVLEEDAKPWLLTFDDLAANPGTWAVVDARPDLHLGMTTMLAEAWT